MAIDNLFGICVYTGVENEGDLTPLFSQDIPDPLWDYRPHQEMKIGGGGLGLATGWASAEWSWSFLEKDARDFLQGLCSGVSAKVLIETKISTTVYGVFTCMMYWPAVERWSNNNVIGLTIPFGNLEAHS